MLRIICAAAALAAAFSCVPAAAQTPAAPAPAKVVATAAANGQSTRANSGTSGVSNVLIPASSVGNDLCLGEETVAVGTLRLGLTFNLAKASPGCERRRDARALGDLSVLAFTEGQAALGAGLLRASIARMCQDGATAAAMAAAHAPCVWKP